MDPVPPSTRRFQSTHLTRGGTGLNLLHRVLCVFQSTHLTRGGTEAAGLYQWQVAFQSTHLTRGGTHPLPDDVRGRLFQSTHLTRGGTGWESPTMPGDKKFQSTHLTRGGTPASCPDPASAPISIHPPHARWDPASTARLRLMTHFNPPTSREVGHQEYVPVFWDWIISIHPPHARWDRASWMLCLTRRNFNPPTSREVGRSQASKICRQSNFNPPTSREVGPDPHGVDRRGRSISIHPPHARWDLMGWTFRRALTFQSTHLTRGGTHDFPAAVKVGMISIHPPHARWDCHLFSVYLFHAVFQSTHLTRGGTNTFPRGYRPA